MSLEQTLLIATLAVAGFLVLLVLKRRADGHASGRSSTGDSHVLYRGGIFDLPRMRRAGISRDDIEQAVRKHANVGSLRDVLEVRLEPTGELTVIEDVVGKRNRASLTPATQ